MRRESDRRPLKEFLAVARANLGDEVGRHRSRPFPAEVGKGADYGFIEPVMADADLYGWASSVAGGTALTDGDLTAFATLRNDVMRSLDVLPVEGRSYFRDLAETATHAHVIEWLRKAGRRFTDLEGASITGWAGVEMALREAGADGLPVFEEPGLRCSQLLSLHVEHGDGRSRVTCSQHDDIFGLCIEPSAEREDEFDGIYRSGAGFDAPVGVVDGVEVTVEEDVIAEVELTISGRRMLLIAGEVEEGPGDRLTMRRLDESVLLFSDAAAVEGLVWVPPRPRADSRGGIE